MNKNDEDKILSDYNSRFKQYGYDPKTLGWDKGKQDLRFKILTSQFDFTEINSSPKNVLDIGCGFGDLKKFFDIFYPTVHIKYTGIDMVDNLIKIGKHNFKDAEFYVGNYLEFDTSKTFDYAFSSGMFNRRFEEENSNEQFIFDCMKKTYELVSDGFAFNFLSDKVDYQYSHTYHSNPGKILEMAFSFSRRVILRNDYMPFEFTIFVFKDDSFEKTDTIFKCYKHSNSTIYVK